MLVELTISAAMLAVAMTLTVQMLGLAARQRRESDLRQRATLEAANLMERIAAGPVDEITPERAKALARSNTPAGLTGAEWTVEVKDESPGPGRSARRVAVRLRWKGRSGEWEAPVRLTTWIERGRTPR
jgi:Tfp pilus assembly protein PilV